MAPHIPFVDTSFSASPFPYYTGPGVSYCRMREAPYAGVGASVETEILTRLFIVCRNVKRSDKIPRIHRQEYIAYCFTY